MRKRATAIIESAGSQKEVVVVGDLIEGLGRYALPGGQVSPGEDPRNAVIRELKEEIGLSVGYKDLHYAFNVNHAGTEHYVYLVQADRQQMKINDPREVFAIERYGLKYAGGQRSGHYQGHVHKIMEKYVGSHLGDPHSPRQKLRDELGVSGFYSRLTGFTKG